MRPAAFTAFVLCSLAVAAKDPRGMKKRIEKRGDETVVTYYWDDGDGDAVITETYRADGFLIVRHDKVGNAHRLDYDAEGRLTRVLRPDKSVIAINYRKATGRGAITKPDGTVAYIVKVDSDFLAFRLVDPATKQALPNKKAAKLAPMLRTFLLLAKENRARSSDPAAPK